MIPRIDYVVCKLLKWVETCIATKISVFMSTPTTLIIFFCPQEIIPDTAQILYYVTEYKLQQLIRRVEFEKKIKKKYHGMWRRRFKAQVLCVFVCVDWVCVRSAAGICSRGFSVPFGLSDGEYVSLPPDLTYHSNARSVIEIWNFRKNFRSSLILPVWVHFFMNDVLNYYRIGIRYSY